MLTSPNGKTVSVNMDGMAGLTHNLQRNIAHESLHSAGLKDQRGPNGFRAYHDGWAKEREAFGQIANTPLARINPDSIVNEAFKWSFW
jgi:hypothetical protein